MTRCIRQVLGPVRTPGALAHVLDYRHMAFGVQMKVTSIAAMSFSMSARTAACTLEAVRNDIRAVLSSSGFTHKAGGIINTLLKYELHDPQGN